MENRKRALLAHLPKWKGFLVNEPGDEMTATEALVELDNLVRCMTDVWVKETGSASATKKAPADFNIQTVSLAFVLEATICPFYIQISQ